MSTGAIIMAVEAGEGVFRDPCFEPYLCREKQKKICHDSKCESSWFVKCFSLINAVIREINKKSPVIGTPPSPLLQPEALEWLIIDFGDDVIWYVIVP